MTIEIEKFEWKTRTDWCIEGTKILHREDGPARVYKNGQEEWYINGKRHREGGPAFVNETFEEWFCEGKRHREDGPAFISKDSDGNELKIGWYLRGEEFKSFNEWLELNPTSEEVKMYLKMKYHQHEGCK